MRESELSKPIVQAHRRRTVRDSANKRRVEKAKELVQTGKYMVYEISERAGFQISTHFIQAFKSIAGRSPSEFVRPMAEGE
ncbi:helix-turn-helix domain-containing protein [Paenibacillus antri]|uniref:Helix-turn-helix domain-containing protein n=1 Tax=Paenibacillus antri TaxID=2582848 RepID=A0A5R9FWN2_9BACL|nr:helix-turn-helix domain-containing protein [Paenibacillus antri]TLS48397.1 helix-turn-helix domain-containing protein [Paenibacillus antri]